MVTDMGKMGQKCRILSVYCVSSQVLLGEQVTNRHWREKTEQFRQLWRKLFLSANKTPSHWLTMQSSTGQQFGKSARDSARQLSNDANDGAEFETGL